MACEAEAEWSYPLVNEFMGTASGLVRSALDEPRQCGPNPRSKE